MSLVQSCTSSMPPSEKIERIDNREVEIGERGKLHVRKADQPNEQFALAVTSTPSFFLSDQDKKVRSFILSLQDFLLLPLRVIVVEYWDTPDHLEHYSDFNDIILRDKNQSSPYVDRVLITPLVCNSQISDYYIDHRYQISKLDHVTLRACQYYNVDFHSLAPIGLSVYSENAKKGTVEKRLWVPREGLHTLNVVKPWDEVLNNCQCNIIDSRSTDTFVLKGVDFLVQEGMKWTIVTLVPIFASKDDQDIMTKMQEAFKKHLQNLAAISTLSKRG